MKWFCICHNCGSLDYIESNGKQQVYNGLTEQGTLLHPHLIDNYEAFKDRDIKKEMMAMMNGFGLGLTEKDVETGFKTNKISYEKVIIICNDCAEVFTAKNKVYAEQDEIMKKSKTDIYKMTPKERITWLREYNSLKNLTKNE